MVPTCQVSRCEVSWFQRPLADSEVVIHSFLVLVDLLALLNCILPDKFLSYSVIIWTYSLGHYFVNNISAEYGVHEAGNVDQWDLMQWLTGQFADKPTRAIEFIKITDLLHYLYAKPNPDPNPNRIKYWQCTKSVIYPKTHLERLYTPNFK